MKMTFWLILSSAVLISAAFLSGCGSDNNPTLATVGDYKITADEFDQFFRNVRVPFATAQDEFDKRKELLDSVIVTRLLVQAAYEKGIDKSEELARIVAANKDKFLIDVLAEKKVNEPAKVSDAEVRDYWNHLEYKVKASHILVDSLDTAKALLARIQNGENFEKLAFEYSKDQSAKKNKGDLGYFTWGQMVDEFQKACWAMEPGEVSPPVKSQFGYHIIKLVDRLPNEYRESYDKMKAQIRKQLTDRKRNELGQAYLTELRDKYKIHIDTTTCDYLLHKRERIYPPMLLETLPKNDFDPEQLDRNEKELVLATWDGGQLSVQSYLDLIRGLSPTIKPDFDDYDSLAAVIFNLQLQDILAVQARRDGLENDPMYISRLKLFKELAMADIMKSDSIPTPPAPDDGQVRQYYDEHPDEFTTPTKVHVYEILLSDELKANKLAKDIHSLDAFKNAAMDLTERPGKRASQGDLGYIERKWFPEIYDAALKTPVGGIGGPVVTQGSYSIFYVADRIDAAEKDFLGVKRDIIQKIEKQQKAAAFSAWVDERKKETTISVNDDAIWKTIDMEKYPTTDDQSGTTNG